MLKQSHPVFLETKTSMPTAKDFLVKRSRLMDELARGLKGRLTTVCAPAGYGKTTLISQWVTESGCRAAWISLDDNDNDLMRFWRYAAHAFSASNGSADSSHRILTLIQALPNLSIPTFLDALINELLLMAEPVIFILDDYQVINEPRIHESLAYFIDYVPRHIHVLIASRSKLPFNTSKWKVRNEHAEISAEQLQFTFEETMLFCHKTVDLQLWRRHLMQLRERTEGWVAGLQLASLSLRSHSSFERMIGEFRGTHQHIADFLFEEVFSQLPEEIQQFLQNTSVLARMDSQICDEVVGKQDSYRLLEQLKERNLFLISLDHHNTWFRYHHLFSEFLQSLLRRTNPEQWLESHYRASMSFAKRELYDEAIDHAIAAKRYNLVEQLMEKHIETVLKRGEFSTLLRWFEGIPEEAVQSADMSLLFIYLLIVTGRPDKAEQKLGIMEQACEREPDPDVQKNMLSGIFFIRSKLIFFSGQFDQWQQLAERLDQRMLPDNRMFYNLNHNMNQPFVRRTPMGLKGALTKDSESVGTRFVGVMESHGWGESLINLYVRQSLCEGNYERNRLEDCQASLDKIAQSTHAKSIMGLYIPHALMQAKLYIIDGQFALAHKVIDEALERCTQLNEYQWPPYLYAFRVQIQLREGELAQARKTIAFLQVNVKDHPIFNREFEYLTFVRYLGRQRKFPQAIHLLKQIKPQAIREGLLSSIVEIALLQASMTYQQGKKPSAIQYLHEALAIGQKNSYVRSFLDEGALMAEMLQYYLDQRRTMKNLSGMDEVAEDYVRGILAAYAAETSESAGGDLAAPQLIEPLTPSELGLLHMIHTGATNKQIAQELALTEGTVKVYLSRIYGKLGVSSRTQALIEAQRLQLLVART